MLAAFLRKMFTSLAKWLSVRLRTKWFWVRVQLQSLQPDKIRESGIFTTFEKIHRSFITNLKSAETKSQIKADLSHLAKSYFYNYEPALCILRQHCVLRKTSLKIFFSILMFSQK